MSSTDDKPRLYAADGTTPLDIVHADPATFTFSITPQFVRETGLGLVRASLGQRHDLEQLADQTIDAVGEQTMRRADDPSDRRRAQREIILNTLRVVASPIVYMTPQQARVVGSALISTAEQTTGLAAMVRAFIDLGGMDQEQALASAFSIYTGVRDEHRVYEQEVLETQRRAKAAKEAGTDAPRVTIQ